MIALAAGLWLARVYVSSIALDDAYITYRYARHLAEAGQLVYNLEQPEGAFATTAPGYAIVLAGFHLLGADIPRTASAMAALGILVAAWALGDALFRATRDSRFPWPRATGIVAGGLLAFAPLLWLVLGMEGLTVLGLTLLGFWFANRRQDTVAAALLGIAIVVRFDAAAAAAAWGMLLLLRRRRRAWKALLLCGGVALALFGLMHFLLGVPLPSTLASKQAQVALGITGFFPNASYLDGAAWIAAGYLRQSPLATAALAATALIGLGRIAAGSLRSITSQRTFADHALDGEATTLGVHLYVAMLLLWTILHIALYVVLGVTPYLWYYLPFVVTISALAAVGLTTLSAAMPGKTQRRWLQPLTFGLVLVVMASGVVRAHQWMQMPRSPNDPPITDPRSAVLPGGHWESYRQAGQWLAENTPVNATVGVSDVGLMGYYSQRTMIDFWGLLDRSVADALARRDLVWALYHHQPDYLALFGEAPLFAYDVFKDRWFQSAYEPIHRVPAGDVTIYQRRFPRLAPDPTEGLASTAVPAALRFGDVVELIAYSVPPAPWASDIPLNVVYYWRVLQQPDRDYVLFTHLLDSRGAIVASRDARPLLEARPMSQWQSGELIADFHPLGFNPLPRAPTELIFEIGFYDQTGQRLPAFGPDGVEMPGGQAQFGRYSLLPATTPATLAAKPPASGYLTIGDYDLSADTLQRGVNTPLTVQVTDCDCPVELTAELWDQNGERLAWQQRITVESPGAIAFAVAVAEGELADWPLLRLRAEKGEDVLMLTDLAGHAIQDTLPLTTLRLSAP